MHRKHVLVSMLGGAGRRGEGYPIAHTCFRNLELPDYDDNALLLTRLRFCLDNVELAGFGLA